MSTKKQLEEQIKELQQELDSKPKYSNRIDGNSITAIHWDRSAVASIDKVAQGLLNLTTLFRSQNIQIDAMIHVQGEDNVAITDNVIIIKDVHTETIEESI